MFNLEPGTIVTGKLVTALKRLGFKQVFDTDFGADLTVLEEAAELIYRIKNNKTLPMLTSCCRLGSIYRAPVPRAAGSALYLQVSPYHVRAP
jgi:hypothetical protein